MFITCCKEQRNLQFCDESFGDITYVLSRSGEQLRQE